MLRYVIRRLLLSVPILLGITTLTYVIINAAPGDPVSMMMDPSVEVALSDADVAEIKKSLGLDKPLPVRYVLWLKELGEGNLGYSGLIVMAAFAPLIAPHDPYEIDINYPPRDKPTTTHPLGTDAISRDILSRVVYASRVSLSVGLVSVSIFVVIGTTLGAIAGYYGGWVDNLIMRAIDIVLSFPSLMLILTVVAVTGPSIYNIMIILGLLEWPQVARLVRGPLLSLREQEFALAAQAVGVGGVRMIFRHLLPNVLSPLVVAATFGVANVDSLVKTRFEEVPAF